ncbi:MAG: hypothetical protein HYZ71_08795 [Deltaproteobacteria bacterium]|nr:hypothetical protein [Deltaproteobacteria bacterium]
MKRFYRGLKIGVSILWLGSLLMSEAAAASPRDFPSIRETNDTDTILEKYTDYLRFVLAVDQSVDAKTAQQLHKNYLRLAKYDGEAAARFLKGLRFEMVHKLELMGKTARSLNTSTPEMRRWVKRFAPDWSREADEQLIRAIATRAAERNRAFAAN